MNVTNSECNFPTDAEDLVSCTSAPKCGATIGTEDEVNALFKMRRPADMVDLLHHQSSILCNTYRQFMETVPTW